MVKGIVRIPLTVVTFLLVCIGWVWFRANSFPSARFVLGQMFTTYGGNSVLTAWHWKLAGSALVIAVAEEYGGALTRLNVAPVWVRTAAVVISLLAIELFGVTDQKIPFVYFQF